MHKMQAISGTWKGSILVRDKNGNPKFDDIYSIPKDLWDMLSDKERKDIEDRRNK